MRIFFMSDISSKATKALKDKLSHLKSGRDSQIPGKVKSDGTKLKEPEVPGLKAPRTSGLPAMSKSEEGGKKDYMKNLFDLQDKSYKQEESFKKSKELKKEEPLMKPFKSDAQRRAMYAAAEGHSNIGIPKKVGKEYVSASKDEDQSSLPEKVKKSDKKDSIKGYGEAKKWLEKRLLPFKKNVIPFEDKKELSKGK